MSALFAEAKHRARRRRRRQLVFLVAVLGVVVFAGVVIGADGQGGGSGSSPTPGRTGLGARLEIMAGSGQVNQLGSVPTLHQLLANFAILRRPQTAGDRGWHPQCGCAGSSRQLNQLTRFAVRLPHGYRVFLDVEQFIAGGQLNTPAGSYMMNLDLVDRYGNTDSTSFGANTQYTLFPLSTDRPLGRSDRIAGNQAFASVVPDGVATVSWTFGCPRGRTRGSRNASLHSTTLTVPVVNNVAAEWVSRPVPDCPEAYKVAWRSADGRLITSFAGSGNLPAPPFVTGRLGHGTEGLLRSSGIGNAQVGSSSSQALGNLTRLLGPPADANVAIPGCAGNRETVWTSPAVADPLTVYARDGQFIGYQYGAPASQIGLRQGPGAVLTTPRGLALGDTIRMARRTYPAGFATQSSPNVGYWSAAAAGARFYGAAEPNYYPARTVAAGDRVATIGAGDFPACTGAPQGGSSRFALVAPGPHASPQTRALYYSHLALIRTRRTGACAARTAAPETEQGAPSAGLLAVLAVLRKPFAPADRLPRSVRGNAPSGRFVQYIRLARTTDGISYYIVPSSAPDRAPTITRPCIAATIGALRAEARRIPASVRSRTLALAARLIARLRLSLSRQTGDGVCLLFAHGHSNGGTCGATAEDIRNWGLVSELGPLAGIVPDGVAAVTIHYPAYEGVPAITATVKVTNNVFATHITRGVGLARQTLTIVWRSPSGTVLKTVRGRTAGIGNSSWCGGCQ